MKFTNVRLCALIMFLIVASLYPNARAADIERDRRITDESIKRDVQTKLVKLFPKQHAVLLRDIYEINLPVFRDYKLLRVSVSEMGILEHPILPDGGSLGMFAYGRNKLLYLNRMNDNLENILWQERSGRVDLIKPEVLAHAIILCKISQRGFLSHLLASADDITAYEKNQDTDGGYVVDAEKFRRYANKIVKPRWQINGSRKELTFYILSGWMHIVQELAKITTSFEFSRMGLKKDVLESKVFKEVPEIYY